jgi:hypothetical protein
MCCLMFLEIRDSLPQNHQCVLWQFQFVLFPSLPSICFRITVDIWVCRKIG